MEKPTARLGEPSQQVRVGTAQPRLPLISINSGRRKQVSDKYRRITLMISPQSNDLLRRIAAERFLGNMSQAVSWSIGLAAATLDGPLRGLQVPASPADAMKATAPGSKP
jgi:hypothetical protein